MDTGSSSSNTRSVTKYRENENCPLWQYVTRIEKTRDVNGNVKWVCNFCGQEKQGTYTRVRAHLLKITRKGIAVCKKVRVDNFHDMRKLENEVAIRISNSQPKRVSLPTTTTNTNPCSLSLNESGPSNALKRRRVDDSPLVRAFDMQTRSRPNEEITRIFYTDSIPFNLVRNLYYISSYTFAANNSLGGYLPLDYKLRTTLFQWEKAYVERLLDPIKSTWMEKGVSIVSDRWSDPQKRPLINIIVVYRSGPMFVKAVDCSGKVKDKHFIANILIEVINEIVHHKVVQIVTDNGKNCKAALEIIEGIFPHIYWTPCVVHTLNLALKNICASKNVESNMETYDECHWITEILGDDLQIKNFIMNHTVRLAMLNHFSSLKLLATANTHFASIVVMLKRFKPIRRALENMVMSDEWAAYQEDDQGKAICSLKIYG